jgi:hypothetical protein
MSWLLWVSLPHGMQAYYTRHENASKWRTSVLYQVNYWLGQGSITLCLLVAFVRAPFSTSSVTITTLARFCNCVGGVRCYCEGRFPRDDVEGAKYGTMHRLSSLWCSHSSYGSGICTLWHQVHGAGGKGSGESGTLTLVEYSRNSYLWWSWWIPLERYQGSEEDGCPEYHSLCTGSTHCDKAVKFSAIIKEHE